MGEVRIRGFQSAEADELVELRRQPEARTDSL